MSEVAGTARLGMNPSRGKFSDYRPAHVTVAVLVHIPHFSGYFEHRLDVLKACLDSLVSNTPAPYDLMVFDNGSCPEVREYLEARQGNGEIQYLLRSGVNVGKIGAFQVLFRAAPGEVVAYSDDDIYFFPGWLQAHLEILDTYPNVGMVTGCAVRNLFNPERISSNLTFAEGHSDALVERGRFISDDWTRDWAESYGRDFEAFQHETADLEDLVLEYRGVRAFAMANHNQFVTPKAVITSCLPQEWSGRLMGGMDQLDVAVNQAGYLRLTTVQRTTQHLGNRISPRMAEALGLRAWAGRGRAKAGRTWRRIRRRLLLARPVRWFLLGLYSRLFRWLNPE